MVVQVLVQSKKKPPVLVPLAEPMKQKPERLHARIQLIINYAERYRELDDVEARELLNLKHILATGEERPKSAAAGRATTFSEAEIRNAISALLA